MYIHTLCHGFLFAMQYEKAGNFGDTLTFFLFSKILFPVAFDT